MVYPQICEFLREFGVDFYGPSEVIPFEPTFVLSCYRIQGKIVKFGRESLFVDSVPISPETADESSFYLWIGEMALPWLQEEAEDDVISPANLPEFMDRMAQIWMLRHGKENHLV